MSDEKAPRWGWAVAQSLIVAVLVIGVLAFSGSSAAGKLAERLTDFEGARDSATSLNPRPVSQKSLVAQQQAMRDALAEQFTAAAALAGQSTAAGGDGGTRQQQQQRQQPQPAQPASCNVDVSTGPIASSCTLLEEVCVDQGRIILYHPKHRPARRNGPSKNLPDLTPRPRQKKFYLPFWKQGNKDMTFGLQPILVRPASTREARQYLAEPAFSNCTVPVVYYPFNSFNFAHVFRDNAARFYSALLETPWAAHMRIVLMTGGGLQISSMARGLWQPLSQMAVTSWAEFSVRLRDGEVGAPPLDGSTLPPSFEGTEQRCFRRMYVCTDDVNPRRQQLHAYGQLLVEHYGAQQTQQPQQAQQAQQAPQVLPPPVSILRMLGRGGLKGEHQLRVAFTKRTTRDRLLVNIEELLAACNSWRYKAPSGALLTARCWEVETPTLATGLAMAQQADVLVGAHGAQLANAYLMRPGSSVIELTPHGFEEMGSAHANYAKKNLPDESSGLQWWKLLLCAPDSFRPGYREAAALRQGTPIPKDAAKWRDLIVRWEAIQVALEAAVDTAGDMQAWRARFLSGRWWWLSTKRKTVFAGPSVEQTCSTAAGLGKRRGM